LIGMLIVDHPVMTMKTTGGVGIYLIILINGIGAYLIIWITYIHKTQRLLYPLLHSFQIIAPFRSFIHPLMHSPDRAGVNAPCPDTLPSQRVTDHQLSDNNHPPYQPTCYSFWKNSTQPSSQFYKQFKFFLLGCILQAAYPWA
jgi:hypothetical protein